MFEKMKINEKEAGNCPFKNMQNDHTLVKQIDTFVLYEAATQMSSTPASNSIYIGLFSHYLITNLLSVEYLGLGFELPIAQISSYSLMTIARCFSRDIFNVNLNYAYFKHSDWHNILVQYIMLKTWFIGLDLPRAFIQIGVW